MKNALLDIAQGASNSAASTVSAPVDAIAWLLRKAGVNIPAPVGGSDWMAAQGLTKQPKNALMGAAGETLGMISPMVAAAKAPQVANALLKAGDNLANTQRIPMSAQRGAIVWHGSPHKFDYFDAAKIGTGEGAQAFGQGIYVAEAQKVGQAYKDALSGVHSLASGTKAQNAQSIASRLANAFGNDGTVFNRNSRNIEAVAKKFATSVDQVDGATSYLLKDGSHFIVGKGGNWWDVADGSWTPSGNLYKIDLPDESINKMMVWDSPIEQQAEAVKSVFTPVLERWAASKDPFKPRKLDNAGAVFGYASKRRIPGEAPVEERLRQAGVPGLRYLDGMSRKDGAGTSNFVVFPGEESLLKILERNGIPLK